VDGARLEAGGDNRRYSSVAAAVWVVVLLALGAGIQAVCVRRDRRRLPPPGRMISGRHVRSSGDTGPAAVFEAGIAASSANWTKVQSALASSTRTWSYDRPGLGWSAPESRGCSLEHLTDDLRMLIHAIAPPRPIVLVGHSFGTYIVRTYAHRFPEDVAGLVLVDPVTSAEWMNPGWRGRIRLHRAVLFAHIARALAATGLVRLGLWGLLRRGGGNAGPVLGVSPSMRRIAAEVAKLPADVIPALRAHWSEPGFFKILATYVRAMPDCAAEAARHPIPQGLPVIVLSGAHQSAENLAAQKALATQHVVVEGSGHWIHLDHPQLVADAVLALTARGTSNAAPARRL
jgi:pimeloyl-ACP methyl ester carboxylesterase